MDVIRLISGTETLAITLSREGLESADLDRAAAALARETGLPVLDPLGDQGAALAALVAERFSLAR
jgi:uncharacterized NAD-dependent epimerase/dehydratase family protein